MSTNALKIFILTIVLLLAGPVLAWADCSTDNPPDCTYVPTNSSQYITPTAFSGASPSCQSVTNNCTLPVMVPTSTSQEWTLFVNKHESCVTLGSCATGCAATNASWLTSCSGPVNAAAIGAVQTVTNTAGGFSGQETATCGSTGNWSYSNPSCVSASCPNLVEQEGICNMNYGPGCIINCTSWNCTAGPYNVGSVCNGVNTQWSGNGRSGGTCVNIGTFNQPVTCQSDGSWQ